MKKMLVFDMDGTIADLYGVEGWLEKLRAENVEPYLEAEPIYSPEEINPILNRLKANGWVICVTTWTSKGGSPEYNKAVAEAKKTWLQNYDFPYDEIHCIKYGRTKASCTRRKADFQILFDDNEKVRKGWTLGATINANNNIIQVLEALV